MMVVGFLLGLWRAMRVSKRYGIASEQVTDAALLALISGIIGARLLFLLLEAPSRGWGIFAEFYRIWQGGLSFHGGLIAAIIAVVTYASINRIKFLKMADLLAPSLAIGYAFARIGCFLNGCCYGAKTHLPWALNFLDPASGKHTGPVHPAQLYAFAANVLIFLILTRVERLKRPAGFVFFSYIVLYSVYRFLIEFIRKGATAQVWFAGLTQAQVASLAGIAIFGVVLALRCKQHRG
jgi:phosphatidylglycerol:prolipoprotein diacylglycerol transferase